MCRISIPKQFRHWLPSEFSCAWKESSWLKRRQQLWEFAQQVQCNADSAPWPALRRGLAAATGLLWLLPTCHNPPSGSFGLDMSWRGKPELDLILSWTFSKVSTLFYLIARYHSQCSGRDSREMTGANTTPLRFPLISLIQRRTNCFFFQLWQTRSRWRTRGGGGGSLLNPSYLSG